MAESKLVSQYHDLAAKVEGISVRERGMVLGTLLLAVGFIWLHFMYDPMEKRLKTAQQLSGEYDTRILELTSEQTVLMEKIKQDPNIVLKQQQSQLKEQIEQQRVLLEEKLKGLIAPSKMVEVLKQILTATGGLKLVSVGNLPVERFSTGGDSEDASEESLPLFMHGLELVIEGQYYDIVEFLLKTEQLEEGFKWNLLDYRVEKFPTARVKLHIQTVSLEEQWIGV